MDVGRCGRHGVPGGARAGLRARRPRPPGRFDPARWSKATDIVDTIGGERISVADASAGKRFEETVTFRHRPTEELDEKGQGACHVAFAFVAQRAVVDVDVDLGLVRVVQVATAQDVGRALNPLSVVGQIEGGIAQGLGLAVMEEIVVEAATSATRRSPTTCFRPRSTPPTCSSSWSRSPIRRRRSARKA